jgi:iron complex transport system substrate-binding protein
MRQLNAEGILALKPTLVIASALELAHVADIRQPGGQRRAQTGAVARHQLRLGIQLPDVGYMRQLNAEGILALKPTLVIASAQAKPSLVPGR